MKSKPISPEFYSREEIEDMMSDFSPIEDDLNRMYDEHDLMEKEFMEEAEREGRLEANDYAVWSDVFKTIFLHQQTDYSSIAGKLVYITGMLEDDFYSFITAFPYWVHVMAAAERDKPWEDMFEPDNKYLYWKAVYSAPDKEDDVLDKILSLNWFEITRCVVQVKGPRIKKEIWEVLPIEAEILE